jgi:hypothetical protein
MPLRPVGSMNNWQLACRVAGWEAAAPDHPERAGELALVREELLARGKSDTDIRQMVDLVGRARAWLNTPAGEFEHVVGDADDIYMALVGEAQAGRLGEAEGRPLLDLLHRHVT